MAEVFSILYVLAFTACGFAVADCVFSTDRLLRRIWLGLAFSLAMMLWFPALFAFVLGFRLAAQLLGLAAAVAVGVVFYLRGRGKACSYRFEVAEEAPVLAVILALFFLCCILTDTHTIKPQSDGALYVGQSTYGDLCMHLGFISSIAVQGTFPPMYSICPDKLVGYPFLSESFGSTFVVLGTSLRFATMLTALYAFLIVLLGVYFFFEVWLKTRGKAVFAMLLFFIGGGFGFAYFFDLLKNDPGNLSRFLTAFYETPTNLVHYGMRWVNPIADMMVPQRALLFGWAFLFPCLFLLYRAAMQKETKLFIPLGILAGCMPLVHTHSFLALGIVSGFLFLRSLLLREDRRMLRGYLCYLGAALLLAGPQLLIFTFPQSTGSLTLHFNWANEADNYFWFYIKNFGLLALLLPTSVLCAKKEDRAFFYSVIPIWLIAEFIQFQPNPYDNNKLLFVCFAFTCGVVGSWLIDVYRRLMHSDALHRAGIRVLAVITCAALFTSGVMTLMREIVSEYQVIGADEVAAAEYVKKNAAPDATFLTNNNHNNCIAALTGRNIVCGSGAYLFYHGIDYSEREYSLPLLYELPSLYFDTLSEKYAIDYVLVGAYERANYAVDEAYFAERFPVFYQNDTLVIYTVVS